MTIKGVGGVEFTIHIDLEEFFKNGFCVRNGSARFEVRRTIHGAVAVFDTLEDFEEFKSVVPSSEYKCEFGWRGVKFYNLYLAWNVMSKYATGEYDQPIAEPATILETENHT